MDGLIEIRVRRFFTSDTDGIDITPSATFVIGDKAGKDFIVGDIAAGLDKQIARIPISDVRPMTEEEIEKYRNDEDETA